jgi:hypothetical protein
MNLGIEHIDFEKARRGMFVGCVIRKVIYGEARLSCDEEELPRVEPTYKTKYADVDTLDYSIYFETDKWTIYVYWDNSFLPYGLSSQIIGLTEETNTYEQRWDVSKEPKWKDIIGHEIVDLKIDWQEGGRWDPAKGNYASDSYPQSFQLILANNSRVVLCASEIVAGSEDKVDRLTDNILVTTNLMLAKELNLVS